MADLLDVNVWLALSVGDHDHHDRALRYWHGSAADRFAFCRLTELALLRLISSRPLLGDRALGGAAAWQALRAWRASPAVTMLDEPPALDEILGAMGSKVDISGKHWTDAYLAAFAMASGSRLVSFDGDFGRYPGLSWLHLDATG